MAHPLKGINGNYPLEGIEYAEKRITDAYAENSIAAPDIEDTGRDGYPFGVIDFASDAGAWADALRFTVNIRVIPDVAFQRPLDAVEGRPDADPATDVPCSFHDGDNTDA